MTAPTIMGSCSTRSQAQLPQSEALDYSSATNVLASFSLHQSFHLVERSKEPPPILTTLCWENTISVDYSRDRSVFRPALFMFPLIPSVSKKVALGVTSRRYAL